MIGWDLIRDTRCGTAVVVFGGSAFEMGELMLGWGCSLCVCACVDRWFGGFVSLH
jgi:hypothetical protein